MRDLKVKDVMTRRVVTVEPGDTIYGATKRLAEHHITGAPVVHEGKVVGMIAERDIVRAALPPMPGEGGMSALEAVTHPDAIKDRPEKKTVAEVMRTLVVEISPEASVWEAAAEMDHRGVNRLPVVDDSGALVGIMSRADLVKVMAERLEGQDR